MLGLSTRSGSAGACLLTAWLLACAAAAGEGLSPAQEAALRGLARGRPNAWQPLSRGQARLLAERAAACQSRYEAVHLPHGLDAAVLWKDKNRQRVERYEGLGDSATWTGHYLAALALKHSVEKDAGTRTQVLKTLAAIDRLTLVTGRPGRLVRYIGPAADPAYRAYYQVYGGGPDSERRGLGRSAYRGAPPYDSLVWLGNSSRDTYDGVAFGLATTWSYAGADKEIRELAARIVKRIGDRLIKDSWIIRDGRGHWTTPVLVSRLVWVRLLLTVDAKRYRTLAGSYSRSAALYCWLGAPVRSRWEKTYYPNNLNFIRLFTLCTLEPPGKRKKKLQAVLRAAFDKALDHLNPHFSAIYLAASGRPNPAASAVLQGMLLDYPPLPKLDGRPTAAGGNNPKRSDGSYEFALLTRERAPADFIWQKAPTRARNPHSHGPRVEQPTVDFFLPYWMGRATGAIPPP